MKKNDVREIMLKAAEREAIRRTKVVGGDIRTLISNNHVEYVIDDVYGKYLNVEKVTAARKKEMRYIRDMRLYRKVEIEECYRKTGKAPIKTRWIDTNKTNNEKDEEYRSRLVAKEFNRSIQPELYSATPPLEL